MRCLNLLRKEIPDKHTWRSIQQKQIDEFNQTDLALRAAFPGSYIFNHIMVPTDSANACHVKLAAPDVSDIVYANCSDTSRDYSIKNTIIIDADEISDLSVVNTVASLLIELSRPRVVVLGKATYDVCSELLKAKTGIDVELVMVEPDWHNAVALHNIYRQASIVCFINSMRVLDAAFTGCECLLVTDDKFRKMPVFNVLRKELGRVDCNVFDESCQIRDVMDDSDKSSFLIVDNSVSALNRVLHQSTLEGGEKSTDKDWLSDYANIDTDPVVNTVHLHQGSRLSGLRDRKTGINRKVAKLRDDPHAFFSDSNSAALRFVARTLWAKSAQG